MKHNLNGDGEATWKSACARGVGGTAKTAGCMGCVKALHRDCDRTVSHFALRVREALLVLLDVMEAVLGTIERVRVRERVRVGVALGGGA